MTDKRPGFDRGPVAPSKSSKMTGWISKKLKKRKTFKKTIKNIQKTIKKAFNARIQRSYSSPIPS